MSAIDDQLKKLLAEQKSADTALKTAAAAFAKSQEELNAAKDKDAAVSQRVAPLQQMARELESSGAAVKQQQQSAAREIDDAEKLFANAFPAISKEINPTTRKALEVAETAGKKSEEALEAVRREIGKAEAAQTTAQAEADAAETRLRAWKSDLGSLADRIESARQRLADRLTAVRDSIGANKAGMIFLAFRDLETERATVTKVADENAGKELLKKIDAAHTEATEALEKATGQAPLLDALKQKLASAEKDLESKRQAVQDARATVSLSPSK